MSQQLPLQKHRIFLSYADEDRAAAIKLKQCLLEAYLKRYQREAPPRWVFVAGDELGERSGTLVDPAIRREVEDRYIFVLLVSPRSLASYYCIVEETKVAMERYHPIIPFILDGRAPFQWRSPRSWMRWDHAGWTKHKPTFKQNQSSDHASALRHELPYDLKSFAACPDLKDGPLPFTPVGRDVDNLMPQGAEKLLSAIENLQKARPRYALYHCDQHDLGNELREAIEGAGGRPLVLYLRGEKEDHVDSLLQARVKARVEDACQGYDIHPSPLHIDVKGLKHVHGLADHCKELAEKAFKDRQDDQCKLPWYDYQIPPEKNVRDTALATLVDNLMDEFARRHPARRSIARIKGAAPSAILTLTFQMSSDLSRISEAVTCDGAMVRGKSLPNVREMRKHDVDAWCQSQQELIVEKGIRELARAEFSDFIANLVEPVGRDGFTFEDLYTALKKRRLIYDKDPYQRY